MLQYVIFLMYVSVPETLMDGVEHIFCLSLYSVD